MINITDKSKCCGCAACAAACPKNCITMKEDQEGFLYPDVDTNACVQCGACERTCPILNQHQEIAIRQDGHIVQLKEKEELRQSTAGGAFTAIAEYVIDQGGIVFGVEMTDQLVAQHTFVSQKKDLERFRNSKYVQSRIGFDNLKKVREFLNEGRMVCFSGTPCQIEGLLNYLGRDNDPNLITVDVVCRAVPSPSIFRKYCEYQKKHLGSDIKKIRFRDKYYGYKYSTMNVVTEQNKGKYHQGIESDPWLRAFFSNICDRPSCYNCQFKKRYRRSDFTIWDCFQVGRYSKELDNDYGATRMLVHTDKGRQIYNSIKNNYRSVDVDPDQIVSGVKEMRESVQPNSKREEFFQDANSISAEDLFNKYFPNDIKSRCKHGIRMLFLRLGLYDLAKKTFVKIVHKY